MMKPIRGACSRRVAKAVADLLAFLFLRKRIEFLGQFRPTGRDECEPMRVMIPPDAQCVSKIRQNGRAAVGIGMLLNPCAQIRR